MKHKNSFTQKELDAIKHIRNWIVHYGDTPSVRELMTALHFKSPRSAQNILESLEKTGVIKKDKTGGYQLIMNPDFGPSHAQTVNIPLVGAAACGDPILAEQNIEGYIPVSTSLAKPGLKYFLLRAVGDSMNKAGIQDDDLVLVEQKNVANEGDKVIALIDDSATIKEFHKAKGAIILKPKSTNRKHQPIILTEDFQIQGVVKAVIPKF